MSDNPGKKPQQPRPQNPKAAPRASGHREVKNDYRPDSFPRVSVSNSQQEASNRRGYTPKSFPPLSMESYDPPKKQP